MVDQQSRRLLEDRKVVEELLDRLETTMASAGTESSEPVSLPVDKDVYIWTFAARRLARHTKAVDAVDEQLDSNDDGETEVDDETAQQAEVEVDVGDLSLDGDDDEEIRAAMESVVAPGVEGGAHAIWQTVIRSDIQDICRHDSTRLYRMFMGITLEISRAPANEEAREIGRDRRRRRDGTEDVEDSTVGSLREVRGFGRNMALDGNFALGARSWRERSQEHIADERILPTMYPKLVNPLNDKQQRSTPRSHLSWKSCSPPSIHICMPV